MKHKRSGKIAKKFASVIAASAIVITQTPGNLSTANANADTEITSAATLPSRSDSDPAAIAAKHKSAILSASPSTNGLTSSNSGTIQPNPTLSMSKSVITASEAGKTVPVTIFINDDNFQDEEYYGYSTIYVDFDGRLALAGVEAGTEDGSAGMSASSSSNYTSNTYRKTYGIRVSSSNGSNGKNGAYATINVTIPADAQPGDIYYFNIFKNNNLRSSFSYSNPKIKDDYDSYTFTTADNSNDKYLKDTPFDGYIRIDPNSQASSTVTSSDQLVLKDLVYYNVYEDHAEVAYCDYEAEDVEIASEINGKRVTGIAGYAFANTNVKSVTLPYTVTTIGSYAFSNSVLESIELPEDLETIPSYAFYNCTSLADIDIPESVTSIGEYAFYNCNSLESIDLPNSVTSIGNSAFSSCSKITAMKLPENLETISSYAFGNCTSLADIDIPESVTSIGEYAFYNCNSLESIDLPNSVTSIRSNVFNCCKKLTAIKLSEKLESIGANAFNDTGIKELTMPATIKSVQSAFSNSNIEKITYPDSMETLPEYAYANATKVTAIELPSKLKAIPSYAFNGCAVKEITIHDGVEKLDEYAFYGNKTLTSVELPDSVTSIGKYAFANCEITSVKLSSNIEAISTRCFNSSKIESIEIPESVKTIGESAFYNSSNLKSVKLSSGLETIENEAFYNCPLLSDIKLPDTLKTIGSYAFNNDAALTELEIPDSVESISNYAFQNSGLKSITIPESVTSFSTSSAFTNCKNLESAVINAPITHLENYCFDSCTSLKSVELPETLSSIGSYTFNNCSSLTSIYIPANVRNIDNYAFRNSGVKTIIGHKGSTAEQYADKNNYEFVEAEVKTWNKKDSLPSVGTYKLSCDVTLDGDIKVDKTNTLDIDLNGHKITIGKFEVDGYMTVRDSSEGNIGRVYTSGEVELFNVSGSLSLVGGTFTGNELEKNAATVLMGYASNFTLDGATVVSHYGSALSFRSYNSNVNLISGTLDTASKNAKGDSSEYAAIYIAGSNYGNVTITDATVKAGKGCAIYKNTSGGTLTVNGGKITSENNYGIYCNNGSLINLSGKLDITGADAGIYIPGGRCITIAGKLTGGNVRIESGKTGVISNRYAEFHNGTDPSEFFTTVEDSYLTLDSKSGEIVYNTDIYENIVLDYGEGRTEVMHIKTGAEVSELPALSGECGFTGWYADSEFTEPFVPFTVGDNNHSNTYYADVHHTFTSCGKCSVCGELKNGKDAFQKIAISIDDDIELQFTITLTEKALADKDLRVTFEKSDGTAATQYISDAVDNVNGTYTFSYSIPYNEFDENIRAQVCYSNNEKGSYLDYSAKKYADHILGNSDEFTEATVNSIKALVNFSGYVQIYAGTAPEDAVNADLGMALDDVSVEISDEFNAVKTLNSDAVTIKSASLSVDELTNIKIRFALAAGVNVKDYKFTINGKEVKPQKSGDTYIVSMVGITPDNFDEMYMFKAESKSNASDFASVEYSCLTYAKKIIETSDDANVVNTMKALYFYNQEIEKYVIETKEG